MKEEIIKKLNKVGYKYSVINEYGIYAYKTFEGLIEKWGPIREEDLELFDKLLDVKISELRTEKLKRICDEPLQ